MRLHILSPGFTSPNGRAFLFPLLVWRSELREHGVDWRLFSSITPELFDCDLLGIDARYYSPRWSEGEAVVLDEIQFLRQRAKALIWFDITDSSGVDQFRPLPIVDLWVKNQLLVDPSRYLQPVYAAGRIWCEYYHQQEGVEDAAPLWSEPASSAKDLEKLRLGWNSGLADYSLHGPRRMALYQRIKCRLLLGFSSEYAPAENRRDVDVACRFGTSYARASVAHQRMRVAAAMTRHASTKKLGRRRYLAEAAKARIILSPFGLGEITLKDFETFRCGALLVKPDMTHMQTWPDFFRDQETMISHNWDIDDLQAIVEAALNNEVRRLEIADQAQAEYRKYTTGPQAAALFCRHLLKTLSLKPAET